MARTVRDAKLETRTARAALKPSGKPYWRAIDEGLHLGYRKGKTGGKWVARTYVGGQSYVVETIGFQVTTAVTSGVLKAAAMSASDVLTTLRSFSSALMLSSPRASR